MAAFTHIGNKSRFSDGSYGAYYCARKLKTAVAETAYHYGRFYQQTETVPFDFDVRVLVGKVDAVFHDLRDARRFKTALNPSEYTASQTLGQRLRSAQSRGIVYPSVRDKSGECLAMFRAHDVGIPVQGQHLSYSFDGSRVVRYFDYGEEAWHAI